MTTLQDLYDDLSTRNDVVMVLDRPLGGEPDEGAGSAVGLMIRSIGGQVMLLEAGVSADGKAFCSVRVLGSLLEPLDPTVLTGEGSALIVA